MFRKSITVLLLILLLATIAVTSSVADDRYQTSWMFGREFQATFERMKDNRFYTHFVEGRVLDGMIVQYRGEFRPVFRNLKYWFSFHGMSDEAYAGRKAAFEAKGLRELYHTSFTDSGGLRLHQACWIYLADTAGASANKRKSHVGKSL